MDNKTSVICGKQRIIDDIQMTNNMMRMIFHSIYGIIDISIVIEKKINGTWINDGDCHPKNESSGCGNNTGRQKQYRNCTDGTFDKCKPKDQRNEIDCDIPCTTTKLSNVILSLRHIYSKCIK